MKQFVFDRLVERENICGLKEERKRLEKLIEQKSNIVLYAPRNYGKTSLIKSIIMPDFIARHKKSFVFFVDLMGVKDLDSIVLRLKNALENSLEKAFPVKTKLEKLSEYVINLKPSASFDSVTGEMRFTIESSGRGQKKITIEDIFQTIEKISKDYQALIVIDEFQDISLVKEAESLFRNVFQQMKKLPIIVLGSKKHLLKNIFALPNSPLASWGRDVVVNSIDYEVYHDYIKDRFASKGLKISLEDSRYLQDLLQRVPESINLVCYEISQNYEKIVVDQNIINETIKQLLDSRSKRFEVMISSLSSSEEKILIQIAKNGPVSKPQSKEFTSKLDLTPKSIKVNINKLMDQGILDWDNNYYICDPLLTMYLKYFR